MKIGHVITAVVSLCWLVTACVETHGTPTSENIAVEGDNCASDEACASGFCDEGVCASFVSALPVADAGPNQTTFVGVPVIVDGTGSSDPRGKALSFQWRLDSKPAGSSLELDKTDQSLLSITPDAGGIYTLELVVSVGGLTSPPATVLVIALNQDGGLQLVADGAPCASNAECTSKVCDAGVCVANQRPIADAGEAQQVATGDTVSLDGSGSSDPEGAALTYLWSPLLSPQGSAAALDNTESVSPTFTADVSGTYAFSLTVNDGSFASLPATVTVFAQGATTAVDCSESPKPAGCPCSGPSDCLEFCVAGETGDTCAASCVESCPDDLACLPVTVENVEVFACLPKLAKLCQPCKSHGDCQSQGGGALALCLDYGIAGSYCGGFCETSSDCPGGYSCDEQVLADGTKTSQCVRITGICSCNAFGESQNLETACSVSNDFGVCEGTRVCSDSGLSACDAPEPALETCDAVDNDCNGITDDVADIACTIDNDYGSCPGTTTCVDGSPVCSGQPPVPETCDGLDNNCNGLTDEGYPDLDDDGTADCIDDDADGDLTKDATDNCPSLSNPDQLDADGDNIGDACDDDDDNDGTLDTLDCAPNDNSIFLGAEETCDGKDNDCDGSTDEGLCDDGVDCTFDFCNAATGTCTNAPDDQLCNDNNACTTDTCDVTGGCDFVPASGSPCDDGNTCTANDLCVSGACLGSPTSDCCATSADCDDGNPCTINVCDVASGTCGTVALGEGASCNADNDGCTVGDSCQNGACVPGAPASCSSGANPCTSSSCSSTGPNDYVCAQENFGPETPCDDGLFCTSDDHCDGAGGCVGGAPFSCGADSGGCQTATCNETDQSCTLTNAADGTVCDDGTACTVGDQCTNGVCVSGPKPDCSTLEDACNFGDCSDLGDGFYQCVKRPKPSGVECNDGDFCTVAATCDGNGSCVGGAPRNCKEEVGDSCNDAFCDAFNEVCIPIPAGDGTGCDDGNMCTLVDTCTNGFCVGSGDACVEERISVGATANSRPAIAPLGYGRYATQWWNASPTQRVRLSDAYGSRENEEIALTQQDRPATWSTRMEVLPAGDFSVLDWSGLTYAQCVSCCNCNATNNASMRGTLFDYSGSVENQNVSMWGMSQYAQHGLCDCKPHGLYISNSRVLSLATGSGDFGFVFGLATTSNAQVTTTDHLAEAIYYYPPTGPVLVGDRVELVPNTGAAGVRFDARMTIDGLNKFLLAWVDDSGTSVKLRRYNTNGSPDSGASTPWTVFDAGAGNTVYDVRVAGFSDSKILVAWDVANIDTGGRGVYFQRINFDGTPAGTSVLVNQYKAGDQRLGEIGVFSNNDFVVVYDDQNGDNDGYAVKAKRYLANGSQASTEQTINTVTAGNQYLPTVAVLDNDDWVVAFINGGGVVWTRRFSQNGTPVMGNVERSAHDTVNGDQRNPSADRAVNGNTLIAFETPVAGKEISEILGMVVDAQGDPVKAEFQLNTWDKQSQVKPAVAGGADRFVVLWESVDQDGSAEGIFGQLLYADGSPFGGEFMVNETTTDTQRNAAVAFNTAGQFLALWNGASSTGGSISDIYGKIYDADGGVEKGEFVVNQWTALPQDFPRVVANPVNDQFLAVWQSLDQDGSGYGIYVRKFDTLGNALSGDVQVHTTPDADQTQAAIDISPDGQFATVCWESFNLDAVDSWGIYCQILAFSDLSKAGGEFLAHEQVDGDQRNPTVGYVLNGNFVVGWDSQGVDSSGLAVQYRRFTSTGITQGPRTTANRYWPNDQNKLKLVPSASASLLTVWQSEGQDGDGKGIFYRVMPAF